MLVLVLVTVLVLLELTVSASLLVLDEVSIAVMVWVMVGLFSLVMDTVTLVFGEPMEEIFVVIGFCWEAIQARPAPRPEAGLTYLFPLRY